MRPYSAGILFLCLTFSTTLWGAAPKKATFQIPYAEMRVAATDYLNAVCTPKKQKAMSKRLARVIKQKLLDNPILQEDSAMRNIMLDWAADNQKRIRKKNKKSISQACFYFIRFVDRKFDMPWQFRNSLDREACTEILSYLRTETAATNKNTEAQKDKKSKSAKK